MIGENIGIDLMLLDINMPQMNGFEVLKVMKQSQCLDETPVIMISSEDAVEEPSGQGRWLIMCPYWLDMCPCKKSLKVQEKSFQTCVCVYLNAIELKKERSFANLSHPRH